jgi:cytochrome c oxidase subunit 1
MAFYLIRSIFNGRVAGNNPWGALTLEWTTTSPPHPHNFETTPELKHGPYDYDKVVAKSTLDD